ncbi:MAG TPA: hypothetical protein VGM37_21840 [Armatimonadota bacterium]
MTQTIVGDLAGLSGALIVAYCIRVVGRRAVGGYAEWQRLSPGGWGYFGYECLSAALVLTTFEAVHAVAMAGGLSGVAFHLFAADARRAAPAYLAILMAILFNDPEKTLRKTSSSEAGDKVP